MIQRLYSLLLRVRAWRQRRLVVEAVRRMPVPEPSQAAKARLMEALAAEGMVLGRPTRQYRWVYSSTAAAIAIVVACALLLCTAANRRPGTAITEGKPTNPRIQHHSEQKAESDSDVAKTATPTRPAVVTTPRQKPTQSQPSGQFNSVGSMEPRFVDRTHSNSGSSDGQKPGRKDKKKTSPQHGRSKGQRP